MSNKENTSKNYVEKDPNKNISNINDIFNLDGIRFREKRRNPVIFDIQNNSIQDDNTKKYYREDKFVTRMHKPDTSAKNNFNFNNFELNNLKNNKNCMNIFLK